MADEAVVKSVGRVFQVLEHFRATKRAHTAIEVARALGFPQSSTMALLKSMMALGYLNFDRLSRTYVPSLRVTVLGDWIEQALLGERHLMELMSDLRRESGETVALCAQNDLEMQVVHVTLGTHPVVTNLQHGQTFTLHESAVGNAVLARIGRAERERMMARVSRRLRRRGSIDQRALDRRLAEVLSRGVAVQYEPSALGLGMVALALPTVRVERGLALAIVGPAQRIRPNERVIVQKLTSAVRKHYGEVRGSDRSAR
jgi:DNA-binding IclR family transcriptional regulator